MASFSVVIPALNEQDGISSVIERVQKIHGAEVIVVDDGSTDSTAEVAMKAGAKVVRHPVNCGYGRSLKDGITAASSDVIVITDADGTYPIEKIPDLLAMFEQGFDMVVGARTGAQYRGSFFKMPARFFFKLLVEFTTGRRIPDINSGLRIFRKSQAQPFFSDICDGFSFTTTITLIYMLTGRIVGYMPIDYFKRVGHSKVRFVRDSLRTLQYITECIIRYNPLKLFLLLSLFTFTVGAVSAVWLGPVSLLLGFFVAMLIWGMGLLADALRAHHSRP